MVKECGERAEGEAIAHRAAAHLNLHHWEECSSESLKLIEIDPSEGFTAGFALFELGRYPEATELILHAAINFPHAASLLFGGKSNHPKNFLETEDYNTGVDLVRTFKGYFGTQSKPAKKFFEKFIEHGEVKQVLAEAIQCTRTHLDSKNRGKDADNLARWDELRSRRFVKKKSQRILAELVAEKAVK